MRRLVVGLGMSLLVMACDAASDPVDSDWVEAPPMEVARSEHPAVVYDEEVVVVGGLIETATGRASVTATVESFDPVTEQWRELPDLPSPRHHLMAAAVDERLFVIGGFSEAGFDAVADVWELVGDMWVAREPLPRSIGAGAAVSLGGKIFVVGGSPRGGLLRYDPAEDRWEELTPPAVSREHLAAVVLDDEIWAIAGRWQGVAFTSTEVYSPGDDSWRSGPDLVEARSGFGAAVVGGSIYVAGGEVFEPTKTLSSTEELGSNGEFSLTKPLPVGLHGNPLVGLDGALLLPGGSERAGAVSNRGEVYLLDVG